MRLRYWFPLFLSLTVLGAERPQKEFAVAGKSAGAKGCAEGYSNADSVLVLEADRIGHGFSGRLRRIVGHEGKGMPIG